MIPDTDKESWERFNFLADWYESRFKEIASVANTPLQMGEGSYEHLELLEQSYRTKTKFQYEINEKFLH